MTMIQPIVPIERIASRIYLIRRQKVMLDRDLAELYRVTTGALNQAVKRNRKRFPPDFMFQLSNEETENWKSQIVIANPAAKMAVRSRPYAFTEQGVAMLSTVLHSDRAIELNIAIMRAFVKLRQVLASNQKLARKIEQHDQQIAILFETVQKLLAPPVPPKKKPIGYIHPKD